MRKAVVSLIVVLVAACSTSAFAQSTRVPPPRQRTIAAVFAHPDDETMAGPLLAHYAQRDDTQVYLVTVTNGDKGVMPFANIPAGEQLAAARVLEATCAAAAFGAKPPVLLGFPDGGLNQSQMLATVATKIEATLAELAPDVIVTWGPEGGYGHPDHRLVSALVTQIVQAGSVAGTLYYAALPASGLKPEFLATLRFPSPFRPVADEFLTMRVPYTSDDLVVARRALGCHKTQFTPESMDQIMALTQKVNGNIAYLRQWNGGAMRTDLFAR